MPDLDSNRKSLCGNCKHFVAGGLCELVKGQINSKATCDLHEFGDPRPIDTEVSPTHNKLEVNYKPGFMSETVSGELAQKAIQMEHELLARGIPEEEVHRAVIAYFSEPEPPVALQWPGPVTGLDLAGRINPYIVPDTGMPTTDFRGLPENVEPYPTPNISPYGIGSNPPYRANPTPDPNSLGNLSNTYNVLNPPYPYESAVWNGLASDVNSEPSMHNEYGYNIATTIPLFPDNYEALHNDSQIHSRVIEPSGTITEAKKDTKKKYLELLAKWALLLGGAIGINAIVKKYLDSGTDKPLELFAKYTAKLDDKTCPECRNANGKIFNFIEVHNRPVLPSENLGYTTRHPNCRCKWGIQQNYKGSPDSLNRKEESDIHSIESHITKAAKKGTLHKVEKDGNLSTSTTKKNPLKELCSCMNVTLPSIHLDLAVSKRVKGNKIKLPRKALQEAITNLRSEFEWLTDDYISSAKKLAEDAGGELYLVRAASESITDHRGEGEPYRRKLSSEELNSMTRTAIGKSMDINHQPEFETDATILDAEFDNNRKEIQMLVIERDPEINRAIDDGKITAVSINGGMPRSESIEPCEHGCESSNCELCIVPKGVVLGELDNIGMTWVVSDPNGLYWNGHFVASAEPGIKVTKIEAL